MKRSVLATVVLVAAASCGGGDTSGSAAQPTTHDLRGVLVSSDLTEDIVRGGGRCYGLYGQYEGLDVGTGVTVRDEGGTIVGTGKLGKGRVYDDFADFIGCEWSFVVPGLKPADFYTIEMGRASVDFSKAELETTDWSVKVSF